MPKIESERTSYHLLATLRVFSSRRFYDLWVSWHDPDWGHEEIFNNVHNKSTTL